jgi:putative transposase
MTPCGSINEGSDGEEAPHPEQIIHLLPQAEVGMARGQPLPRVCRKRGVSEQTYYRSRKEGVRRPAAPPGRTAQGLGRENEALKRLVAEAELDKSLLREAAAGNS